LRVIRQTALQGVAAASKNVKHWQALLEELETTGDVGGAADVAVQLVAAKEAEGQAVLAARVAQEELAVTYTHARA